MDNSAPTGLAFMKVYIRVFFENLSIKVQSRLKLTRITGTLHEDRHHFLMTPPSVLLRMRNVADKSYRGIQNTHFVFNNFFSENRAFMR